MIAGQSRYSMKKTGRLMAQQAGYSSSNSRRPNQRSPDSTHINIIWGGINAMHGFWSGKQLLIYHREKR